jgi:hypothetical protein
MLQQMANGCWERGNALCCRTYMYLFLRQTTSIESIFLGGKGGYN